MIVLPLSSDLLSLLSRVGRPKPSIRQRFAIEVTGGVDEADEAEGLWCVAQLPPAPGVVLLAEETDIVAQLEQSFEQGDGLVPAADALQGVHEPEAARDERALVTGKA